MRKTMKKIVLLSALSLFLFEVSLAQLSKVGTTAADFLRIPVGARASAMSAFVASVNDPSAMLLNPAGLSDIGTGQILVEYTDWYMDMNHTFLGAALPVHKGAVGVHVLSMDYGQFEETTAEAQGLTGRTFQAYSVSFGATYSRYLIDELTIGGTARMVHEQISNSSASTILFDIGTIYTTPYKDLKFGVSVGNIGAKFNMTGNDLIIRSDPDASQSGNYEPDAKLATDAFAPPLGLKVGFEWKAYHSNFMKAILVVDGNVPSNNTQSLSVGGELSLLNDQVFLRGGIPYIGQPDATERFNGGIGFRYAKENQPLGFAFHYTYHGYKYLGDVSKISLQISF